MAWYPPYISESLARVAAMQFEAAEPVEARQGLVEGGSRPLRLSDERLKDSAQTALLLAVQVPDIVALKAAVQLGEAAGLADSELLSAKAALAQLESDALDAEIQTLMAENAKLKCQAAQRAALAKPAMKPAVKRSGGTSKAGRQRSRFVP